MLLQHALPAAGTKELHTADKGGILPGKMLLQQGLQHILFQQLALSLVRHPHGRVQSDFLKMIADQV